MTTNSAFAASTTSVLHNNSTSGADLNHTATEAKEVETVDVASDALCCGSSAQKTQQQQQQQQQQKKNKADEPQPPPRAAPRCNPPTPKPRSVLPPTTTLMTTATSPATTLNHSTSSITLKSAAAAGPTHAAVNALKMTENVEPHTTPRSKQRLIKVDFSLLQDDDNFFDEPTSTVRYGNCQNAHVGVCSQPQMPPYPIGGYMSMGGGYSGAVGGGGASNANAKGGHAPVTQLPSALTTRVLRRTSI